jgi:perosamine synthetase
MIRFNKPTIVKQDLESVLYCMIKDDLSPGQYLKTFSSMLSAVLGITHATAFMSYVHAFETVFTILGASAGDEVLLPSFARTAVLHCLKRCCIKPVVVDVEHESFLPSRDEMKRKLSPRTRCILIPQMFGIPSDLSAYRDLGLPIIEDTDGSIGSRVNGKPIGSFGDFITMNLGDSSIVTTGCGGMLAAADSRIKPYLDFSGEDHGNDGVLMSDLNASLGISQLERLEKIIEARKKISGYYDEAVFASDAVLLGRDEGTELSFSAYVVKTRTPYRECSRFFRKYAIPIRRGIEQPLHVALGLGPREYPNSEEMFNSIVALPIYPALKREDIENIVRGIRAVL